MQTQDNLLEHLREAGLRVSLGEGQRLMVGPAAKIGREVAEQIKAARDTLVQQLQYEDRRARCLRMLSEDPKLRVAMAADEIGAAVHVTTCTDGVWDNIVLPLKSFSASTYLDGLTAGMQ
jgi:hypothetical protein